MKMTPEEYRQLEGFNDMNIMIKKASENAYLVETFRKLLEDNGLPTIQATKIAFNLSHRFIKVLDFGTPVELTASLIETMSMYISLTWLAFTEQNYNHDQATQLCLSIF